MFILVLTHLICCACCYSYVSTLDLASHAEDSCAASRAAVDARAAGRVPGGTEVVQWQQGAGCGVDAASNWIACGGGPVAVLSWACGRVAVLMQWLLGLWPS